MINRLPMHLKLKLRGEGFPSEFCNGSEAQKQSDVSSRRFTVQIFDDKCIRSGTYR